MKLIVATNNEHKLREIKEILGECFDEISSLKQEGITVDVEETGDTFEENALIKAEAVKAEGVAVLADDSGLCVDALNGAPGVYSARYAAKDGHNASDADNRKKLLMEMRGIENRSAKFVAAIALVQGENKIIVKGETHGSILFEEEGNNGFGYDSLFFSDELNKSFGVSTAKEKNEVSHRAKALKKLLKKLKTVF